MLRSLSMALAFSMAVMPLFASAQDIDCKSPQTQTDMNICAAQDYERADAELNRVWGEVRATLQTMGNPVEGAPNPWETMLEAQRAWITFRDLACDAESAIYYGGSIRPLIYSSCLTRLTEQRMQDIRDAVAGF